MANPRRIYRIYAQLAADAATVRDFALAKGEKVSGTVTLLLEGDRAKLLRRFGEEMAELCGVLDGSHDDSYLMEATQTWYWLCLFAATGGTRFEDLGFATARQHAATCGISSLDELRAATARLVALGAAAKPEKAVLLWLVADRLYRQITPPEQQWTIEQLMDAELHEMGKRAYLAPILRLISD